MIQQPRRIIGALLDNIGKVIIGKEEAVEYALIALLCGGHVLIEDVPGVGKTTLLRVALGLLKPDGGTVENRFRKTAAVFQEPRLLPWRTAAENVNLVLKDDPATLPYAKARLAQLGLEEAADKYPRELSGGMQQRVALARALAAEADLLILDEPFKAMDEALRDQVIAQVAQTDAAILLVTHDEAEAKALGCEIVKME